MPAIDVEAARNYLQSLIKELIVCPPRLAGWNSRQTTVILKTLERTYRR